MIPRKKSQRFKQVDIPPNRRKKNPTNLKKSWFAKSADATPAINKHTVIGWNIFFTNVNFVIVFSLS